jgi:5-methylcytosine-specific restriction endonuclease McrA
MIKSWIGDHCWVCSIPFSSEVKQHLHHIIPRAFGGVDGPVVSLDDSHHSRLHEIALRLYSKKPFIEFLSGNREQDQKLLYLAQIVCNARLILEDDPNRYQVVVFHLNKEYKRKFQNLKGIYKNLGRQKLLEAAIDSLHRKHFVG